MWVPKMKPYISERIGGVDASPFIPPVPEMILNFLFSTAVYLAVLLTCTALSEREDGGVCMWEHGRKMHLMNASVHLTTNSLLSNLKVTSLSIGRGS